MWLLPSNMVGYDVIGFPTKVYEYYSLYTQLKPVQFLIFNLILYTKSKTTKAKGFQFIFLIVLPLVMGYILISTLTRCNSQFNHERIILYDQYVFLFLFL